MGAIAIVNQATVLTRNTKDFGQIADLVIEDWTMRLGDRTTNVAQSAQFRATLRSAYRTFCDRR